jgi:hypothetical protein
MLIQRHRYVSQASEGKNDRLAIERRKTLKRLEENSLVSTIECQKKGEDPLLAAQIEGFLSSILVSAS